MSAAKDKTSWLVTSGPGLLLTIAIGAGLGYLFAGDLFNKPPHQMMILLALGLVWAQLLLQWIDLLMQGLSLSSKLVPDDLDLSNSNDVAIHTEALGGGLVAARVSRLLGALASGADSRQVIQLAAFQSSRVRGSARALAALAVILLVGVLWQGEYTVLAWAALLVLAVTLFARLNLLARTDELIEARLLSRLPGSTARMVGGQGGVAASLGSAVKDAFKEYIPQPAQMSESISEAIKQASAEWSREVGGSLSQHADALQASTSQLNTQLDRIAGLQENIEKILRVQETVDGVMQSVSATSEFQQTLSALRNHVEETDKVLRNLSKPRRIKLVESKQPGAASPTPPAPPVETVEAVSLPEADSES